MIISADKKQRTDGSAYNMLQRLNIHTPIVLITRIQDFEFNDELLGLDTFIVADFSEHGWDFSWQYGTPLFGKNFEYHKSHFFDSEEYIKLNQFISDRRPLIYFKRELLKKDANDFYVPIEYCSWHQSPLQTEEEFNSRQIEVFFNWGLSNPMRPILHGHIWSDSQAYGYSVCDNYNAIQLFLENEKGRRWITINTPHYMRIDIKNVLHVNGLSKLSICLWGAGRKCFRTTGESPLNAVMMLPEDDMAYNHAWISGYNCIKFKTDENMVQSINEATKRKDLYEIYKNGHATCEKYRIDNYAKYLSDIINQL